MKYIIGTHIPAKEILRRFKDEDGDIFVEVRGMEDVLFRVTDGNQVYYKIEKSKMKGEELILMVDYTIVQPKIASLPNVPTAKHRVIREDDGTETDPFRSPIFDANKKEKIPADKTDFDEGDKIPKRLRDKCKKNEYGGYTLRYNNFLYMLDVKYRVEIKTMDSNHKYELEENAMSKPLESTKYETTGEDEEDDDDDILTLTGMLTDSDTDIDLNMNLRMETDIELEQGDKLPARLRSLCEAEIGHGYGSRIILGNYLYQLDSSFSVLHKMKISYMDESGNKDPEPTPADPEETAAPMKELSIEEIVTNVVNIFETALDTYNIHADYFKETALVPDNREILIRAYHGDLERLNDDTREAASLGKIVKLPDSECGFNLFKAALIHELYIKSTVSDRGENMKYFLTLIAAAQPDGTVGELQDSLSLEGQKNMVKFFKDRAHVYTDKTDTITRVYLQVRGSIFEQYEKLSSSKEKVRFNALLIYKLYEHTTRLDRGNGITMIRLTRDLLEYPGNEY